MKTYYCGFCGRKAKRNIKLCKCGGVFPDDFSTNGNLAAFDRWFCERTNYFDDPGLFYNVVYDAYKKGKRDAGKEKV